MIKIQFQEEGKLKWWRDINPATHNFFLSLFNFIVIVDLYGFLLHL